MTTIQDRKAMNTAMVLSVSIGLLMMVMKLGAYLLTGSAAILSDAAESVVHVIAVFFAAYSLKLSYRPSDDNHRYGYAKISFFSAGFEGAMIILAAIYIMAESIHSWVKGIEISHLGAGTIITAIAVLINGVLGLYIIRLGKKSNSLILTANGEHVMTDCWTSIAVLVGLGLVLVTKWLPFDPICGLIMAGNILFTGFKLMRSAYFGLMDKADTETVQQIKTFLEKELKGHDITYHELRVRNLGDIHWADVHLVFPAGITLTNAHRLATTIENMAAVTIPNLKLDSHLECISDHDQLHPKA